MTGSNDSSNASKGGMLHWASFKEFARNHRWAGNRTHRTALLMPWSFCGCCCIWLTMQAFFLTYCRSAVRAHRTALLMLMQRTCFVPAAACD
jgi:hypothetical protein